MFLENSFLVTGRAKFNSYNIFINVRRKKQLKMIKYKKNKWKRKTNTYTRLREKKIKKEKNKERAEETPDGGRS